MAAPAAVFFALPPTMMGVINPQAVRALEGWHDGRDLMPRGGAYTQRVNIVHRQFLTQFPLQGRVLVQIKEREHAATNFLHKQIFSCSPSMASRMVGNEDVSIFKEFFL